MNQSFDTSAWRKVGEQLWSRAQQSELVLLPWNNPWRRFAALALVPLVCAGAAAFTFKSRYALIVFALLSVPFVVSAIIFFIIGRRTGGLYSFFSGNGFGVGCEADKICIPYSSIQLPKKVDPATLNKNHIILPARAETTGIVIERKDGTTSPWDGKPYKRGIVSVFIKDGALHVRAFPNEMILHLFYAIHPLSVFLTSRTTEQVASEKS
jgi:hypothetical protein